MREAIGSSMLLYIVIIIVGAIMLLFVSIISYAKAYGAKNRIVSAIETFGGYTADAKAEIDTNLGHMGYTITSKDFCNSSRVKNHLANLNITSSNLNNSSGGRFGYCVYEVSAGTTGSYYVTVTFINFNIPVIGSNLVFPVYGQTKIVGKDYNY